VSVDVLAVAVLLLGVGLIVAAGRIRERGGPGAQPSPARGLRGRPSSRPDAGSRPEARPARDEPDEK
jgi:hypothetical protein